MAAWVAGVWQAVAARPKRVVAAAAAVGVLVGGLVVLGGGDDQPSALRTTGAPSTTSTTQRRSTTTTSSTTSETTAPTTVPETTVPSSTAPPPPVTGAPATTAPPAPVRRMVAVQVGSAQGLVTMRLDGSDRRMIASGEHQTPELSRDGRWLVAIQGPAPSPLVTMDVNGGNVRSLAGSFQSPSISPDGREIAVVRISEGPVLELVRLNRDLSNPRVFPVNSAPQGYWGSNEADWAPDGGQLAITNSSSQGASRYDIATGTMHGTALATGTTAYPEWSPDGTRLAFHDGRQIVVVDLGSGERRVVAPYAGPVTWESSSALLFSQDTTTYRVAATGGPVSVVCQDCMHPAA